MNTISTRQISIVVAVIVTIVVNALANALPLNGLTTAEISDRFDVYFVPAGYVFSIWGLIYLALILFAIYQALPAQRDNPRLTRISALFALSCFANISWLFLWHYEQFPFTLIAMFLLLAALILIYRRLGIGKTDIPKGEKWFVQLPFSIYLAWVTVATIANIAQVLDFLNWNGWGISAEIWTVIMLVAAAAITLAVNLSRGDAAFVLVIIWAYIGIAIKQTEAPSVSLTAWAITGLLVFLLLARAIIDLRRRLSPALAS